MQTKTRDGVTYQITDDTSPELAELILNSDSLDERWKRYWFETIPEMTELQISELLLTLRKEKLGCQHAENRFQVKRESVIRRHALKRDILITTLPSVPGN